jgi:hypothetical protein
VEGATKLQDKTQRVLRDKVRASSCLQCASSMLYLFEKRFEYCLQHLSICGRLTVGGVAWCTTVHRLMADHHQPALGRGLAKFAQVVLEPAHLVPPPIKEMLGSLAVGEIGLGVDRNEMNPTLTPTKRILSRWGSILSIETK